MVAVDKTSTDCQIALAGRDSLKPEKYIQTAPVLQMVLLLGPFSISFLGKLILLNKISRRCNT